MEATVAGPSRVCDTLTIAGVSGTPHSLASGAELGYQYSPQPRLAEEGPGAVVLTLRLRQPAMLLLAAPGPRSTTVAALWAKTIVLAPLLAPREMRLLHGLLRLPHATPVLGVTRAWGGSRLYIYTVLAEGRKAGYLPNLAAALSSPEGVLAAETVGLASRLTGSTDSSLYLLEPPNPRTRGCMLLPRGMLARLARLLAWSQATCPPWDVVCTGNLWHLARSLAPACPGPRGRRRGRPRFHLERPEHLWPSRTRAPREAVERLLEAVCSLHHLEGCSQAAEWASTAAEPLEDAAEEARKKLEARNWA